MMKSNATMMPWTSRRSQTIEPSMLFFVEEDDIIQVKLSKAQEKPAEKMEKPKNVLRIARQLSKLRFEAIDFCI